MAILKSILVRIKNLRSTKKQERPGVNVQPVLNTPTQLKIQTFEQTGPKLFLNPLEDRLYLLFGWSPTI